MPNANEALLKTFQKAYQNLDITPLLSEKQVEQFGVEYGTEVLEELVQLVEDNAARDGKIMFFGHRGCGKSTLLAEFGRQCADRYFVVFFSIAETMEMSGLSHVDILFAVSVNLMLQAEQSKINISKGTQDSLYRWFGKRTKTEIKTPVSAEGSIGFDFFKIITAKLKTEVSVRNELKQEFERNISDLISKLNEIAAIVQSASKKEVLVIIDDLDKLDLADVRSIKLIKRCWMKH